MVLYSLMLSAELASRIDVTRLERVVRQASVDLIKAHPDDIQLRLSNCGLVSSILLYTFTKWGYDARYSRTTDAAVEEAPVFNMGAMPELQFMTVLGGHM